MGHRRDPARYPQPTIADIAAKTTLSALEYAGASGKGLSTVYAQVASGEVPAIHAGRTT